MDRAASAGVYQASRVVSNYSSLFSTYRTPPRTLCPFSGSPVQEKQWHTEMSPMDG